MHVEQTIANLNATYQNYRDAASSVDERIIDQHNNENEIQSLIEFNNELIKFDAKLRLGMAMREIRLNDVYVNEKSGDLKECHLMLYKLADVWFSYESYFRLHRSAFSTNLSQRKIYWLDDLTNQEYFRNIEVVTAKQNANTEISNFFNNAINRAALKGYLNYCSEEAEGRQKERLLVLANNIVPANPLQNYSHTEILSMTYAIRNNFAHNGEITIFPEEFNYHLKNAYLKILYRYLVVITISVSNITVRKRLGLLF